MNIFKNLAKRYADKKEHKELLKLALEITSHLETDERSASIIGRLNAMSEREKIIDNHNRRYELLVYEMLRVWKHDQKDHKVTFSLDESFFDPGKDGDKYYVEAHVSLKYQENVLYYKNYKFPKVKNAPKEFIFEELFKELCVRGIGYYVRRHLEAIERIEKSKQDAQERLKQQARKQAELAPGARREREIATAKMLDKYAVQAPNYTPDQYASEIIKAVKTQQNVSAFNPQMEDFKKVFVNPKTNEIYHFFLGDIKDRVEKEMFDKRDPRWTLELYSQYVVQYRNWAWQQYRIAYSGGNKPVDQEMLRRKHQENIERRRMQDLMRQGSTSFSRATDRAWEEREWEMLNSEARIRNWG